MREVSELERVIGFSGDGGEVSGASKVRIRAEVVGLQGFDVWSRGEQRAHGSSGNREAMEVWYLMMRMGSRSRRVAGFAGGDPFGAAPQCLGRTSAGFAGSRKSYGNVSGQLGWRAVQRATKLAGRAAGNPGG
ncbi:hypothetical protein KFK09_014056 [Dendrobium nobile]|uniref:Uncharacterized protein n=1 Tax=Dendrobium nobile TaxID=94219 RepID=A0A8T3BAS3_DENNO|nr:hypothetical protein KFK09_014056 [Dendrobium nobile]